MNDYLSSLNPFASESNNNDSIFPSLSLKERLIGFGVCFVLGSLFQFMSLGSMLGVLLGRPNKFAFLYTCGNLISIFGTFFLVGPKRQFHNMTHPYRRKAASIFLSSIVLTIISLYVIHSRLLTIISVIIQFCSYIWYIATYIPYGQECLGYLTRRFFGGGNNDNTTS